MSGSADWFSYDTIASRYDEVWGSRFGAVARLLWDHVPAGPTDSVLDLGTGTGIVLQALAARRPGARLAGCDRSVAMVRAARSRLPAARLAVADAARVPFRDGMFAVVTASFVLSHLPSYEAALAEARRVLSPGGVFAMTSWAADPDVHAQAWRDLLAEVVPDPQVRAATASVVPWEGLFETAAGVEGALSAAGFREVEIHTATVDCRLSAEHFLADRELSSSGRFASHVLGPAAWRSFLARAHDRLQERFGPVLQFPRRILIGRGRRRV